MTDGKPALDWLFALQDMYVSAADRSGGDAYQGIKRADIRNRFLFENDTAALDKDGRLHAPRLSPVGKMIPKVVITGA
jgi:hypothetical protein